MSKYSPPQLTATRMRAHKVTSGKELAALVIPVLEGAIEAFENIDWTVGAFARDSDGKAFHPVHSPQVPLSDTCALCLTGAIHYSIATQHAYYPNYSTQLKAFALTEALLLTEIQKEPENESPRPIDETFLDTIKWNDHLEKNGKKRVVNLLKRALANVIKETNP